MQVRGIVIMTALTLVITTSIAPYRALASPVREHAAAGLPYRWRFPVSKEVGAWTFQKGVLAYDGESNAALFAPLTLKHVANFAVQATMRGLGGGGPQANLAGFGLVVRTVRANPHTSISAGSFFSSNSEDNNPEIYWNGDTVGGEAFDPGTAWHVYRFEVQGNQYTLLIDGKTMVQYTIADYPYPSRVGIFSTYYKVQVRSFMVSPLGPASAPVPVSPNTERFNLTLSDLPPTTFYSMDISHYYPNVETARERKVSLSSLEATGRIVAYARDFYTEGANVEDIYSSVAAFDTPSDARADIGRRLSSFRDQYSTYQHYLELPANQIGDASGGISFDVTSQGYTFHVLTLYFARGSYTVQLIVTFNAGALTADEQVSYAMNLAKIVDGRIVSAT